MGFMKLRWIILNTVKFVLDKAFNFQSDGTGSSTKRIDFVSVLSQVDSLKNGTHPDLVGRLKGLIDQHAVNARYSALETAEGSYR
jgi:hypothetical protein